jgi:hypothetical protein
MSYCEHCGCPPGFHDLTEPQQQLLFDIQEATSYGCWPTELKPALHAADAPTADKAAVAEFLGGPGAGREFRP